MHTIESSESPEMPVEPGEEVEQQYERLYLKLLRSISSVG